MRVNIQQYKTIQYLKRVPMPKKSLVDGWMNGWMDGWMGGREQQPVLGLLTSIKYKILHFVGNE